jgi:outer membrane immunogenic protein
MKSAFSLVTLVGAALAAFSPMAASAAPATPSYGASASGVQNWEGFYGGINVGAMWGDFSGNSATAVGPTKTGGNVMGGVQGGYNWQQDRLVLGGEVDFLYTPIEAKNSAIGSFEENWTSTIRARAGYAFDKWLPYATVGLGLTNTDSKIPAGSVNNTHVGYAIGAGFDYAVSDSLSWRTEFLHVDVPEESDNIAGTTFTGGSSNNIVRIGANYRFR